MNIFLRNILGPIWLLVVASYYFPHHEYYASSFKFLGGTGTVVFAWLVIFGIIGGFWVWKKKKSLILTPAKVILSLLFLTWITGVSLYFFMDPAVLSTPFQIVPYADGQIAVIEEGVELNESVTAAISRGDMFWKWEDSQQIIPPELHVLFTTKSVLAFGGTLALNLLKITGAWLFFVLLFHNLGAFCLRKKELKTIGFFESIGMGMGVFMAALFLLGALGILNTFFVWGITIIALVLGGLKFPLLKQIFQSKTEITFEKKKWWVPIVMLLSGIPLSLNLIEVLQPFPGGFDSIHRYQNTPNLLIQYNSLVESLPAYNFELIFSLGQFLFNSKTIGASLSVLGAFLGIALLFVLLKKKFKWEYSFLLTTIFVSLPMTQFMLHADFKIDLPLLFFSLLAIYSALKSRYILTGIWLGIAFGIKYTSALLIFVIFGYFGFVFWGILATIGISLLGIGVLGFTNNLFFLQDLSASLQAKWYLAFVVVGIGFLIATFRKNRPTKKQLKSLLITALLIVMTVSPWLIKNGLESSSISPTSLLYGSISEVEQTILSLDESEFCHYTEYGDELKRYTGYFEGSSWWLPVVILWESTINSGMTNNRLNTMGLLFLGFAVFGVFAFQEAKKQDPDLRKITGFTLLYILLWLISAKGIVWYGMPLFAGLLFLYGTIWKTEKWPYIVLGVWLLISLTFRVYETQTETNSFLYAGGLYGEEVYQEIVVPGSEQMAEIFNTEEALSKNIYMVGGFISYFAEFNDQRVYRDFLLDQYMCRFYDENPTVTLEKLREANIGYVLYSTKGIEAQYDDEDIMIERFETFKNFLDTYLKQEVYREEMILYTVPDA
ncbi:hypothetical protein HN748_03895 [Candidatus Peregrinibacteria bacterium]|jgi:hypothetical protein|nr:hypothetical protein [Candidatus Peregrinibacteria bacterium]MBT7703352.1 hypothetical protein [Candidatus Peregrinibacteria bacterium]